MTDTDQGDAVVIRRRIAATRHRVFQAWLDADGMGAWMCPGGIVSTVVELDARVGGALRIVMHGAGEVFDHWGEFTLIEPPSKLAFTWHAKATDYRPTLVTVELFDAGDHECDLVLTHTGLPRPTITDQYRGGWHTIVGRLAQHLAQHHANPR